MSRKGIFIAIEGNEGSGKSTMATRLLEKILQAGHRAIAIHEPGSTPLGDHLRTYLKEKHPIDPTAELLLFAAARAQLTNTVILPALNGGTHVIADRYKASTVAYQGFGRQLDLHTVDDVNAAATGGLDPDLTLWLDIPPGTGIDRANADAFSLKYERRAAARRFEDMSLEFHQRVARGYRHQADNPGWSRLDATLPLDLLTETAYRIVANKLRP